MKNKFYINTLCLLLAAFLGVLAVICALLFKQDIKYYDSPFFPLFGTAIENFSIYSIFLLFFVGFLCGIFNPKYFYLWGVSTVFFFPIIALIEILIDPSSHNLWPIEFIIYGLMSVPGLLGAIFGFFIVKLFHKFSGKIGTVIKINKR